ncbi:MAG: beta-lactamase family protein [Flavobacteriales bacterium]|jgi:CubicO group peptidase (beta-lactamase class C family)|nr:beta-lactamase family protein [Flavobacteriales bacterium]
MRIILSLAFILAMLSCEKEEALKTSLPDPKNIQTEEDLSEYLSLLSKSKTIQGFSLSIASQQEIVFQSYFGFSDAAKQKSYTNQTQNSIASISKTFLAAATSDAIEKGLFSWETDINNVLPFTISNPNIEQHQILIKDLATHTSGINDGKDYLKENYYILENQNIDGELGQILTQKIGIKKGSKIPLETYLENLLISSDGKYHSDYFTTDLPTDWTYSNTATALLGLAIEHQSGMPYEDYLQKYIFAPLHLSATSFDLQSQLSNMTKWYYDENQSFPRYANHSPVEGGVYSNNIDMALYLKDMMLGLQNHSQANFSNTFYQRIFSPKLQKGIVPNDFAENMGMLWYLKQGTWQHGGNDLGNSSHIQIDENGLFGFILQTNMDATFVGNTEKWIEIKNKISLAINQYRAAKKL